MLNKISINNNNVSPLTEIKTPKILIVDDRPENLLVMEKVLKNLDAEIHKALSGQKALALLLRHHFALILLDVQMPEMDGFETASLIRGNRETQDIPIIFVTAISRELKFMFEGYELGAVDYLLKPIDPLIITSKVKVFLQIDRQKQKLEMLLSESQRNKERIFHQNQLILNAAGEGIYGLDDQGNTTFCNPAAARMIEYEVKDLIGRSMHDIMHHTKPDGLPYPKEECPIYGAFKDGKVHHVTDEVFYKKDGTSFPVEYISTPMRDEGVLIGAVVIFKDIRKQKLAEGAIIRAKEEAERANRAKSEFLSRMSHDLRTPLNAVIGLSQVLTKSETDPLTSVQKIDVELISKAGQHLLALINEILEMAQIESGKIPITLEPIDVSMLINEPLDLMSPLAKQKGIVLKNHIKRDTGLFLLGDKIRLRQVLLNLISNAIKYNQLGGSVTLSDELTSEGMMRISVTDTGLGIPVQQDAHVFEPFTRFHEEVTDVEGTGIGLAICKKLMNLMKGRIDFRSRMEKGTCFFIELPVCDPPPEQQERKPAVTEKTLKKKRKEVEIVILYIEDQPSDIVTVGKFFKNSPKIMFLTASRAKLGLELALVHRPNLILMDIDLPGMDGIEAFEHLQSNDTTRNIPVIAVSAIVTQNDIEKALKAGFKEYITKPIDMDHFLKTIDRYLG